MTEAGQAGRLFVPLASGPFEAFRDGRKTVEVRQARGRWHTGNVTPGRRVLLRRGYSTRDEIAGTVGRVAWASRLDEKCQRCGHLGGDHYRITPDALDLYCPVACRAEVLA